MLLPILLVVGSVASGAQATDTGASKNQEFPTTAQHRTLDPGFVIPASCPEGSPCKPVCASIRAYVFSDGENPQLKYVTDCPNLKLPEPQRARKDGSGDEQNHRTVEIKY